MSSDIIYNKLQIIERCLIRIAEEYDDNEENLKHYTKQDSIILNIQRACQAAIDLAMHIVAERKLGLPQNSRDVFELLANNGVIDNNLSQKLQAMVGFRNIAIHDYQAVNLEIIQVIIEKHLDDLRGFIRIILQKC
jgi:uncharacterized protein YutE (UPF0331/DUF86 family)